MWFFLSFRKWMILKIFTRGIEFKIDRIFGDIDYNNFSFTYKDVKKHVMNSAFSACLKLYKRDFIDGIDFRFPQV